LSLSEPEEDFDCAIARCHYRTNAFVETGDLYLYNTGVGRRGKPSQGKITVAANVENPPYTHIRQKEIYPPKFDYWMSFSPRSDIYIPMGWAQRRSKEIGFF
jgi:hypothetical protein